MWTLNCGCSPVSYELYEFNIKGTPLHYTNKVILPNLLDDSCCLKRKIILDYLNIISQLECGILPDIKDIILEISVIDIRTIQDFNIIKEIYSSNKQ